MRDGTLNSRWGAKKCRKPDKRGLADFSDSSDGFTTNMKNLWKPRWGRTTNPAHCAMALAAGLVFAAAFAEEATKNSVDAWTAPARAARKQNPVLSDATSIVQGKELFLAGCLPCHGPAGKGDGPAAAALE